MSPSESKAQDSAKSGKNQPRNPREKQRDEESSMAGPGYRKDPTQGNPSEDKKGKQTGQKSEPRPAQQPPEDEHPLQEPGTESDALKPGR
jgi:hypothetical protein